MRKILFVAASLFSSNVFAYACDAVFTSYDAYQNWGTGPGFSSVGCSSAYPGDANIPGVTNAKFCYKEGHGWTRFYGCRVPACPEGYIDNGAGECVEIPEPEPEPQNCEELAGQTVYLSYPYEGSRPTSHNGCEIVLTNGGVEVCSGSPPTTCSATFEYTGAPGGDGGGGGPGGDPGGGDPGGGDPGGGDPGGGDPGGGDPGGGDCDEGDEDCTPGGGSGPGDCDEGDEDCTPGGGTGPGDGDGDGDGDGGGSASSGMSCNVSPQCKGPAIECAIFFETWRNRCANPMITEISDDTQQLIVENVETTGTALLDDYEQGFMDSIGEEWGVEFDADAGTPLLDLLSGNACTNYRIDVPVLLGRGGNSSFGVDCSDTKVVRDVLGWGFSVLACFMIYGLIRKPVNR